MRTSLAVISGYADDLSIVNQSSKHCYLWVDWIVRQVFDLSGDLPPGGVAVHRRRIAYYAGAPAVKIPDKPPKNVIVKMRKWGAEYLIISDEDLADYPWLAEALPVRAELLHREEANGVTAFVYRLLRKRKPSAVLEPPLP